MADIYIYFFFFTKWLPMETFHTTAPLNRLWSVLHVRVERYLGQLVKNAGNRS